MNSWGDGNFIVVGAGECLVGARRAREDGRRRAKEVEWVRDWKDVWEVYSQCAWGKSIS